jgi:hypothetical protein
MPLPRKLASNDREWRALVRSKAPHVVRNKANWKKVLASKDSPLKGIDPKLVRAFSKSLAFKDGGLAHADYTMLVNVVPFRQFKQLWAHFGMDLGLFADHDGYYCESKGSCAKLTAYICTSNC